MPGKEEWPKAMSEDRPPDQPLDRMMEQPDLTALRDSYKSPSRTRLRMERLFSVLGRVFSSRSVFTLLLAIAILLVLVIGYMQLN